MKNIHRIIISRGVPGLGVRGAAALIKTAAAAALDAEGVGVPCEINVLLTDDDGIRELNAELRGIDAATDVLSFPMFGLCPGAFDPADAETDPETGLVPLGDMALSLPRCAAQGEELGHGARRELLYLTVHSALHLLGYDHTDEGAMKKQMRAREKYIMQRLGEAQE